MDNKNKPRAKIKERIVMLLLWGLGVGVITYTIHLLLGHSALSFVLDMVAITLLYELTRSSKYLKW